MTQDRAQKKSAVRTIAVFSPNIQGFYYGEIINQIRQLCEIKGYRLEIIHTLELGTFDLPVQREQLDAVISIRNAISPELAKEFLEHHIPCASIAYDFFPLRIPVITSDNEEGAKLAFEHLKSKGFDEFLFVGDLTKYDIRKRYEYFCDQLEQAAIPIEEEHLITVEDSLFSGGYSAAKRYLVQANPAKAIVFGAGLTGVGFIKHLQNVAPDQLAQLELVCFDALPMIPVLTPQLTAIDQNVHLIAYRTLNCIESMWSESGSISTILTPPKIVHHSEEDNYQSFIATCVDLPSFHNPNYMKAITCNTYEWVNRIVDSDLEELMTLAPLFEHFMAQGFLTRLVHDKHGEAWLRHNRTFNTTTTLTVDSHSPGSQARAAQFPPATINNALIDHWTFCVHLPIKIHKQIWGVLSLYATTRNSSNPSNFFAFAGIMESITRQWGKRLELLRYRKDLKALKQNLSSETIQAKSWANIRWNLSDNLVHWSDEALHLLAFDSHIERTIYRNIELTDRLHKEDTEKFREALIQLNNQQTPLDCLIHLRLKDGQYKQFQIRGNHNPSADAILFELALNDEPSVEQD